MNTKLITEIKRALEDLGYTLTAFAAKGGWAKQSVSQTLRRPDAYPAIRNEIIKTLGYNPWDAPPVHNPAPLAPPSRQGRQL